MSTAKKNGLPAWLWVGVIAALAVAVALLLRGRPQEEPAEAYQYDISAYQQVDPGLVIYRETGALKPGSGKLSAVATAPDGAIYVAVGEEIVVYTDDAEERRITVEGTPDCLALSPDGELLIGRRDHLDILAPDGTRKHQSEGLGKRAYITAIVANDTDIYAADAGQRIVLRFDRTGKLLGRIGEADDAQEIPGFIVPSPYFDVAFDQQGALWAVNPGRHGLESYRANGDLVTSWYRPSMQVEGFCGCCNPIHVAFRSDGSLVTAEKGVSRIKLYAPDWTLLGLVAAPGAFDETPEAAYSCELETPIADIAVDTRDRVLVIDNRRGTVRIFEKKESSP